MTVLAKDLWAAIVAANSELNNVHFKIIMGGGTAGVFRLADNLPDHQGKETPETLNRRGRRAAKANA